MRQRFSTLERARAWSEGCWQDFKAEVAQRQPALTLISSEHFSGLRDPAQLPSPLTYTYPARRQLESFLDLVRRDNMIVRCFSRSNLVNGDVVEDFMATLSSLGRPLSIPSLRGENKGALYTLYRAIGAIEDTARRGRNSQQSQPDKPWLAPMRSNPCGFATRC